MIPRGEPVERVAIIGCGYTGSRLAEHFLSRGASVRAFGRRIASPAHRIPTSAEWSRLDLDAEIERIDFDQHLIYYLVPPSRQPGDVRLTRFLETGVQGVPKRVIYLSTTGVYGDQRGAVVTENTVPDPRSERASRRLAAEAMLRAWAQVHRVSWCILRVPGIYGPGRLPVAKIAQRSPVISPAEATPGNRIHVVDLVSACVLAGLSVRADRQIYNVTDGSEVSHTEFVQRVATLAGLPLPPLIGRTEAERTFSPLTWSFLAESRRIDNSRMLTELGVALRYGDLDAGIRASLDES